MIVGGIQTFRPQGVAKILWQTPNHRMLLDFKNPQTPHRCAAMRQLDLILDGLKQITTLGGKDRLVSAEIIRPAFAALRWLKVHHFQNDRRIAFGIDLLERKTDELAHFTGRNAESITVLETRRCPACGEELTDPEVPGTSIRTTVYCPKCFGRVWPAYRDLCSLRNGFGTDPWT